MNNLRFAGAETRVGAVNYLIRANSVGRRALFVLYDYDNWIVPLPPWYHCLLSAIALSLSFSGCLHSYGTPMPEPRHFHCPVSVIISTKPTQLVPAFHYLVSDCTSTLMSALRQSQCLLCSQVVQVSAHRQCQCPSLC